jgi:DNA-binding transcriptional regulator PaaX
MGNIHKKSLTRRILNAINSLSKGAKEVVFTLGPLFDALMSRKTLGQTISALGGYSYNNPRIKGDFRTALRRLEKNKLIKFRDSDSFVLTKGGKEILLKFEIDDIKLPDFNSRNWDKKWRVLIFDIPELSRAARDIFRGKLQELGFYELQKSVYVTPRPCEREIMELARMLRIEKSVHILEASKLGSKERAIRKFFGVG